MVTIEEYIENTPVPASPSFFADIKGFAKSHPYVSVGTLGLAVITYGAANLVGRVVSRLLQCFDTTKKSQDVAINRFSEPKFATESLSLSQKKIHIKISKEQAMKKAREIASAPIKTVQYGGEASFLYLSIKKIIKAGGWF